MCRYLPEKPLVRTAVAVVTMGNELFSQHLAKVTSAEAGAPSPLHELLLPIILKGSAAEGMAPPGTLHLLSNLPQVFKSWIHPLVAK